MKKPSSVLFLSFVSLAALLALQIVVDLAKTNYLALQATRTLITIQQASVMDAFESDVCRDHWLSGLLYNGIRDMEERNASWVKAGACDKRYVVLMHRLAPTDQYLADLVNRSAPGSPEVWFWLGDLTPEHAVEYYRFGLNLDPTDARRWMSLASLLEFDDPQASLDALIHACELGDPGENACLGAGNRFRSLGDVQSAINIMRKATWRGTLDYADRLEKELEAGK